MVPVKGLSSRCVLPEVHTIRANQHEQRVYAMRFDRHLAVSARRVIGAGFAALLAIVSLGFFAAVPAGAQTASGTCGGITNNYEGTPELVANPVTVVPGNPVTIVGTGWPANTGLDVSINGAYVATVTTNAAGSFQLEYTVPANTTSATIQVSVMCDPVSKVLSLQVSQPASSSLPVTGSNSFPLVAVGVFLVLAGTVVVVAQRRWSTSRRSESSVS